MENELGSRFDRLEAKIDGGFGEVDRRLEGLEGRFDGLEERFDGLGGRFDGLEERFDGLEERFDGLGGRFDGLEERFDGLGARFDGLETRLTLRTGRLEERIDATEREMKGGFASLERGQELILKAVRGHTTSLEAVDKSLRELDRRVSRLEESAT